MDIAGNVYVADGSNNRIVRFNPTNFAGTFTTFGSFGSGSGQFSTPSGIAVDSAGKVYVADRFNSRIDRFDPTNFAGTFTSYGSFGNGSGQFNQPTGVTVDSAGNVYVAEAGGNSRIASFSPSNFAGTFATLEPPVPATGSFMARPVSRWTVRETSMSRTKAMPGL